MKAVSRDPWWPSSPLLPWRSARNPKARAGGTNGIPATKPQNGRLDPSSPAYQAYERFLANEHANYKAFVAQKFPNVEVLTEYDTVLKTLTLSGGDANLSFPETVNLPASGTATFTVSLSFRGAETAEGDLEIKDGDETFLVPFHYSTGN